MGKFEENSQVHLKIVIDASNKSVKLSNQLHNSVDKLVWSHPERFGKSRPPYVSHLLAEEEQALSETFRVCLDRLVNRTMQLVCQCD